jgi:hypothetical protein
VVDSSQCAGGLAGWRGGSLADGSWQSCRVEAWQGGGLLGRWAVIWQACRVAVLQGCSLVGGGNGLAVLWGGGLVDPWGRGLAGWQVGGGLPVLSVYHEMEKASMG